MVLQIPYIHFVASAEAALEAVAVALNGVIKWNLLLLLPPSSVLL
jgi:hypothetical protein